MKQYVINLSKITPQGKVETSLINDELQMTTTVSLNTHFDKSDMPIKHNISLPGRYQLPLRINMMVKINAPTLYLLLGKGHVNFLSDWQDNRRLGDIIENDYKPHSFQNGISLNTYVEVAVIYDFKFMQILVNGEERYFSKKEKYMKSKQLENLNKEGFEVKIACSKHTELSLREVSIIEYEVSELVN